jgi:glutamyl-tRNA reductase
MSHTMAYAEELAQEGAGTPLAIAQLDQVLPLADVIFTVTAAPHPVLDRTCLAPLAAVRKDRKLMIFDLGVPRNTEPEVRQLPFVCLHDIEDLKALSEAHRKAREREIPLAEAIVDDELCEFGAWCRQRSVVPMISELRARAEQIRQHQLSWALGKLGDLTDEQKAVLEQLTGRLVKQLLHHPISELRQSAGEEDALAAASRLIGLDPKPKSDGTELN